MEESRRLLRLPQVSEPSVPAAARIGLDGVSPWDTRNGDFSMDANGYLVNSAGQYLNGWSVNPTTRTRGSAP